MLSEESLDKDRCEDLHEGLPIPGHIESPLHF